MSRNLPGNKLRDRDEVAAYNFRVAAQLEKSACCYIQMKSQWNLNSFLIHILMLAGSIMKIKANTCTDK